MEPWWEKEKVYCVAFVSRIFACTGVLEVLVLLLPLHILVIVLLLKLLDKKCLLVWISWTLLLCIASELAKCLLVQGILQENNVQILLYIFKRTSLVSYRTQINQEITVFSIKAVKL